MKTFKVIIQVRDRILVAPEQIPGNTPRFTIPIIAVNDMFGDDLGHVRATLHSSTGIDVTEAIIKDKGEFTVFELSEMQTAPDWSTSYPLGMVWVTLGVLQLWYSHCAPSLQHYLDLVGKEE